MSLAALTIVAALLLAPAPAGHWSGRLGGGSEAAKVSFDVTRDGRVGVNVATCGGHDRWTARRASR